jgi:hypothetical protein
MILVEKLTFPTAIEGVAGVRFIDIKSAKKFLTHARGLQSATHRRDRRDVVITTPRQRLDEFFQFLSALQHEAKAFRTRTPFLSHKLNILKFINFKIFIRNILRFSAKTKCISREEAEQTTSISEQTLHMHKQCLAISGANEA